MGIGEGGSGIGKAKAKKPIPERKPPIPSYCTIAPGHPLHGPYHDNEYGFPSTDESVLFERLALEIMQAGLSWEIVLKKRAAFRLAFAGFDAGKVARFGEAEIARLVLDPGIIRNRRKIESIIENARRIVALRPTGGFAAWLEAEKGQDKSFWVKRFKKAFVFTGPEVVGEFLMSLGILPGAHGPECPVFKRIARLQKENGSGSFRKKGTGNGLKRPL